MNQILHILKKDVRHLWPWIVLVLSLFLLHAWLDVLAWASTYNAQARTITTLSIALKFLLTLGVWFFVASAVFVEPIPGDRQFWLTRPYSRAGLFAAKLLLLVLFINIPLFLSDLGILASQGLLKWSSLTPLLLREVAVPVLFVLPAFAIASVSTGLMQFVLGWFLLVLLTVLQVVIRSILARPQTARSVDIMSTPLLIALLAIASISVVLWQYFTRRTKIARAALLFLVLFSIPIIDGVDRVRSRLSGDSKPASDTSSIHFSYDSSRKIRMAIDIVHSAGTRPVMIPLHIEGIPPHTLVRGHGDVTLRLDGAPWPKPGTAFNGVIEREDQLYWQTLVIDETWWQALDNRKVDLASNAQLELVTDTPLLTIAASTRRFRVPHLGLCRTFAAPDSSFSLMCRTAYGNGPKFSINAEIPDGVKYPYSDLNSPSLPLGWSPTVDWSWNTSSSIPPSKLVFIPRYTLATWHTTFSASQLQTPPIWPNTPAPIH